MQKSCVGRVSFSKTCPFITDEDVLSITPDFTLKGQILHDVPLGVAQHLQPPAEELVRRLQQHCTFRELVCYAAERKATPEQLYDLLGFFNMAGGLHIQRRAKRRLTVLWAHALRLAIGVSYPPVAWRRPFTAEHLLIGIWRAAWPLVPLTALLVWGFFVLGLLSLTNTIVFVIAIIGVFAGSLVMHEAVHAVIIRRAGARPYILQRGFRLGIIHFRLPYRQEALSALAGPVAGVACCAIAAAVGGHLNIPLVYSASCVVASCHLLALLPWYSDGSSLIRALGNRRQSP